MPEDRYKDLVLIGKEPKRLSYIDEFNNYISTDIKLKDEIDTVALNMFFGEVYKGTRYFYSIPANQFIQFFQEFLKNNSVINLSSLYQMIIFSQKEASLDEMVIRIFQTFLDMFEITSYSIWTKEEYATFLRISQERPELDDKIFHAEKEAMFVNSNIMHCMKQMKNKEILKEVLTKAKVRETSSIARR